MAVSYTHLARYQAALHPVILSQGLSLLRTCIIISQGKKVVKHKFQFFSVFPVLCSQQRKCQAAKTPICFFFLALLGLGAYNVGTRWHCQRMKYGKKEESALENHVEEKATRTNFIWDAIDQALKEGRYQPVHTRFPPAPTGYMHIGHCKALIMDFLTAEKYGGKCNLRFDDTNPAKEDTCLLYTSICV